MIFGIENSVSVEVLGPRVIKVLALKATSEKSYAVTKLTSQA